VGGGVGAATPCLRGLSVGVWAGRGEIGPWANLVSPLKSPLHLHPCQRTSTHTPPDPALYHRIPLGHDQFQR